MRFVRGRERRRFERRARSTAGSSRCRAGPPSRKFRPTDAGLNNLSRLAGTPAGYYVLRVYQNIGTPRVFAMSTQYCCKCGMLAPPGFAPEFTSAQELESLHQVRERVSSRSPISFGRNARLIRGQRLPLRADEGGEAGSQCIYSCIIDSAGRAVVIGSACRCTTFQVPSSGRKIIVTRRGNGTLSSLPPTLPSVRSIHTM